jgi:hypothetical protein
LGDLSDSFIFEFRFLEGLTDFIASTDCWLLLRMCLIRPLPTRISKSSEDDKGSKFYINGCGIPGSTRGDSSMRSLSDSLSIIRSE